VINSLVLYDFSFLILGRRMGHLDSDFQVFEFSIEYMMVTMQFIIIIRLSRCRHIS